MKTCIKNRKSTIPILILFSFMLVALYKFLPTRKFCGSMELEKVQRRDDFGILLEKVGFKTAIEIGVQDGKFAETLLRNWPSFEKYYGIDPWIQQETYIDSSNRDNKRQNKAFEITKKRLARFGNERIALIRNFSNNAVSAFVDSTIDFIYIDGRHDYCSAYEDLTLYYPKLKCNGIMAGHDFMPPLVGGKFDWTICPNGSRVEKNGGGVKGAVIDFLSVHGIKESEMLLTADKYPSFYFKKICKWVAF